jgi:hypothetical protein
MIKNLILISIGAILIVAQSYNSFAAEKAESRFGLSNANVHICSGGIRHGSGMFFRYSMRFTSLEVGAFVETGLVPYPTIDPAPFGIYKISERRFVPSKGLVVYALVFERFSEMNPNPKYVHFYPRELTLINENPGNSTNIHLTLILKGTSLQSQPVQFACQGY